MDNSALQARFDSYDADADGRINLSEFGALLEALGLGYEDAQVSSAFTELDGDRNGAIDFAEFSEWWVGR